MRFLLRALPRAVLHVVPRALLLALPLGLVLALPLGLVLAGCTSATPELQANAKAPSSPAGPSRYVLILDGKTIGTSTLTHRPDGVSASYTRQDGTQGQAELSFDARGLLLRYRQAEVGESFAVEHDVARWSNPAERGTQPWTRAAFYLPFDDNPLLPGLLARALLEAREHRLPLLPAGEATLEPLSSVTLPGGRALTAHLLIGMNLEPSVLWFDAQRAESGQYGLPVAETSGATTGLVEQALAEQLATLNAAHAVAMTSRRQRLAAQLTHRPAGGLLIENVRLFDPRTLSVTPGTSVWIRGTQIIKVGPDGTLAPPAGAAGAGAAGVGLERLDGRGRFAMPGLWENHAHLWGEVDAAMLLAAGITTTRDMSNDGDLPRRAALFDAGTELGPRVVMAMRVDVAKERFRPGMVEVVTSETDAARVVDTYAARGYSFIKVGGLDPALVPTLSRLAHARGLKLVGHVPQGMTAREFIAAGADEISHSGFLVANFFAKETPPPGEIAGQASVRRALSLDLTSSTVKEFAQLLVAHKAAIDPTVLWTEVAFAGNGTGLAPTFDRVPFSLPVAIGRQLFQQRADTPREPKVLEARLALIRRLYDEGVGLVPGTDAANGNMVGFGLQRELELYAQAGISPAKVLQLATYGSAANARLEARRGVIAPGYDADVILIDGDPSRRISDVRNVEVIVKNGAVFDAMRIYRALGLRKR
jgi:imidazolonepropionase-like amidohydrolase